MFIVIHVGFLTFLFFSLSASHKFGVELHSNILGKPETAAMASVGSGGLTDIYRHTDRLTDGQDFLESIN